MPLSILALETYPLKLILISIITSPVIPALAEISGPLINFESESNERTNSGSFVNLFESTTSILVIVAFEILILERVKRGGQLSFSFCPSACEKKKLL